MGRAGAFPAAAGAGGGAVKVIDRYLAGRFGAMFALVFGTFLGLFVLIEFFEKLRLLLKYEPEAWDVVVLFAAKLPWIAVQAAPMACLLATLVSLVLLSRHGEITALRSSGLSLARLARPFLLGGLAVAAVAAPTQEFLAPRGMALHNEVKHVRIKGKPRNTLVKREDLWVRSGDRLVHVARLAGDGTLQGVSVARLAGGRLEERLDAPSARWDGEKWRAAEAQLRVFGPDGRFTTEVLRDTALPIDVTPEDLTLGRSRPDELSWWELRDRVRKRRAQGLDARNLEVGLWAKTSMPFVSVLMPLLAFPFGIRGGGRKGGVAVALVWGVGLGFAYWLVVGLGLSLGKTGALPPPVAAWAGNLVFAAVGVGLLVRAERGAN